MATPVGRKLKVAAVLAALPMFLAIVVLGLGTETTAAVAQASLSLPTYDAIAAEVGDDPHDQRVDDAVTEDLDAPSDDTASDGFADTASSTTGSSRSTTATPRASAKARSRVDFPTERGPCNATTGSSDARSSRIDRIRRSTRPPESTDMTEDYRRVPGIFESIYWTHQSGYSGHSRGTAGLFAGSITGSGDRPSVPPVPLLPRLPPDPRDSAAATL